MIRKCKKNETETIFNIINDAARAYEGVIPRDRWKVPYMSMDGLQQEMKTGVIFWGYEEGKELQGVMGIQDVQDVTLIRHAYVLTNRQNKGIGGTLLSELRKKTSKPILIGTWTAAFWAIRFYEKYGFRLMSDAEKYKLLRKYWSISERQVETSVVLRQIMDKYADFAGLEQNEREGEDYAILYRKTDSKIAIMAPHGGGNRARNY